MSKANSHLFLGTLGQVLNSERSKSDFLKSRKNAVTIIAERAKHLDTREHPIKNRKYLSNKQIKEIEQKIRSRTATMEEYKNLRMTQRLNAKRKMAVREFWIVERTKIQNNLPTTRNWTQQQKNDILARKRPKYNGKVMQGHHTYSVKNYPHLAGKYEIIYPVTYEEHFYGWHGGNWKNSLPGKQIKKIRNF